MGARSKGGVHRVGHTMQEASPCRRSTCRVVDTLICHLPSFFRSLWRLRSPNWWFFLFFCLAGFLWFYSNVVMQPESSNSSSLESNLDILISTPVISKPGSTEDIQCKWLDCGKSFAFLDDLASHVSTYHANSGPGGLFYCRWDGCGRGDRGFNARYKMLVHVRTHTNEKPHQCFQCNKSFSRAENLKIHARSHTGERPYVCPVPGCGKAYSNSSDRFKHTRTHSVHKPYVCKVPSCGKRYTDPSSLRKHVKTYRHFPTGVPLDENSPGRNLEEMKMDEENEDMASKVDFVEPMETSSPLRSQGNLDNTTSLSLTVLKKWLKSESMLRSFANTNKFSSNENCGYFQEQDIPLDLTVRK